LALGWKVAAVKLVVIRSIPVVPYPPLPPPTWSLAAERVSTILGALSYCRENVSSTKTFKYSLPLLLLDSTGDEDDKATEKKNRKTNAENLPEQNIIRISS
ncbi:hypothetical protein Ocin01_12646, partial [Orchesella cincta]